MFVPKDFQSFLRLRHTLLSELHFRRSQLDRIIARAFVHFVDKRFACLQRGLRNILRHLRIVGANGEGHNAAVDVKLRLRNLGPESFLIPSRGILSQSGNQVM